MLKLIPLKELFIPVYGVNLELIRLERCDKDDTESIRFVSRTERNNGVVAYVKRLPDINPNPAHTISVAVSGSVLASFYQPEDYYSGRDLYYLVPKRKMSKEEMIFYAFCIRANKYKYNYGRQASKTLKDIFVPQFMPQEFADIDYKKINTLNPQSVINKDLELDTSNWKPFELKALFKITGSKTTPILKLEEYGKGKYPYVTTQATNNGVEGFYDYYTEEGNVLSVDSAVLGYCGYQPLPFSASDHVEKLIPKFNMNKYIALFIATAINAEQYRYNYGRKCCQERMEKSHIKLPSKNGKPDFEFMEIYIKSLPYSSSI
ncbi:MAG: restriction endonuclease subunit S [Patescibacteria group bacterium]